MQFPKAIRHYGPRAAAGGLAAISLVALAALPSAAAPDFKAQFGRLDANGDGKLDKAEFVASLPEQVQAQADQIWSSRVDADGDGSFDCNDACPADAAKVDAGQCGCGVADTDADSDIDFVGYYEKVAQGNNIYRLYYRTDTDNDGNIESVVYRVLDFSSIFYEPYNLGFATDGNNDGVYENAQMTELNEFGMPVRFYVDNNLDGVLESESLTTYTYSE